MIVLRRVWTRESVVVPIGASSPRRWNAVHEFLGATQSLTQGQTQRCAGVSVQDQQGPNKTAAYRGQEGESFPTLSIRGESLLDRRKRGEEHSEVTVWFERGSDVSGPFLV